MYDEFVALKGSDDRIQMTELVPYLTKNGYTPSTEELEGLLRRLDHDNDGALSLTEFAEALTINQGDVLNDEHEFAEKEAKDKIEKEAADAKAAYEKALQDAKDRQEAAKKALEDYHKAMAKSVEDQ